MKLKLILFSLISFLFLTSHLQAADPWLSSRIEITITPQKPASYRGSDREFLANPVYQQGERAVFNITFRQIQRIWFPWNRYIDIPAINLLATFPNDKTQVRLKRISQGRYTYTSPVLTKAGNRNHTLRVAVIRPPNFLNRKIKIIASNKCSISVIQLPLNIQITSPQNGALLNTNQLTVSGTINDNTAVVTVNGVSARVNSNQFTAEINLQEDENQLTARARNRHGTVKRHVITVTIDTIPPQNPAITINEGLRTELRLIHLTLSAEGSSEIIISENPNFTGSVWEPYVETKEYTLSENQGFKSIYIKYKDRAGNETLPLRARILLGRLITITSPTNATTINSNYVTVAGTINGDTEGIKIYINGLPARITNNTFWSEKSIQI